MLIKYLLLIVVVSFKFRKEIERVHIVIYFLFISKSRMDQSKYFYGLTFKIQKKKGLNVIQKKIPLVFMYTSRFWVIVSYIYNSNRVTIILLYKNIIIFHISNIVKKLSTLFLTLFPFSRRVRKEREDWKTLLLLLSDKTLSVGEW